MPDVYIITATSSVAIFVNGSKGSSGISSFHSGPNSGSKLIMSISFSQSYKASEIRGLHSSAVNIKAVSE